MYRNFGDAFIETLYELLFDGNQVYVKGNGTLEVTSCLLKIKNPLERIICTPARNNNIFATVAETLWVLAGRNDIAFLEYYLPRAGQFSDDGEVWRAGYGKRIRHFHAFPPDDGVDQLSEVINILNTDHSSRQAVISIFDPACDYQKSKDIPCLSGNTILKSPESNLTLEQLAIEFSVGTVSKYPIYSFNPTTKDMKLSWCTNVWKSGRKKACKIHFDDGSDITCTEDHILFKKILRNSKYCEEIIAKDLRVGDRVWATQFFKSKKGYSLFKRNLAINTCFSNIQKVHVAYAELVHGKLESGVIPHHRNEIKSDNSIRNLQLMTESEHNSYHRTINNPMQHMTVEQHAKRAAKISITSKRYWENVSDERREKQSQIGKSRCPHRNSKGQFSSNHVITAIEYLQDEIDVYDFEVEDNHNAMLNNGVFVHNCTNWIHFMIRENKLNMSVVIRSNDIMWGASGINWFEWSVIQELVANSVKVDVGSMSYFADSMHIYSNHYERAHKILEQNAGFLTMYDCGAIPTKLSMNGFIMDSAMKCIFDDENSIRTGTFYYNKRIPVYEHDDFLKACVQLLAIDNSIKREDDVSTVYLVNEMYNEKGTCDLRFAVLENLCRKKELLPGILFHENEKKFLLQFKDTNCVANLA